MYGRIGTLRLALGTTVFLSALVHGGSDLETRIAELELRDAQHQQTVAELHQEIRDLRDRHGQLWMDDVRREEIREIVQEVLCDADARSSLLQNETTAGWNKGFFLASADGAFRLKISGMLQFRWIGSFQDSNGSGDSSRWGFENTRTRFGFSGHVVDPSWTYFIWTGYGNSGSNVFLDAWIQKSFGNGWSVKAGQFKAGGWQEWLLSETRMQFVERSTLTSRFGGVYTQGVSVDQRGDQFRFNAQLTDGLRNRNTPYATGPGTGGRFQDSTEWAISARGEWLVNGLWANANHNTSFQGTDALTVLGAAVHYQVGEYGTVDDEVEVIQLTADANMKFGGASLFAGFIWTSFSADASTDRDEWGALIQGGYFINKDWELIARLELGDLDGAGTVTDDLAIVTLGVNRFWNGHGLKWTTDIGFALEEIDAGWVGQGWRANGANDDGQILLRSQLHLLF